MLGFGLKKAACFIVLYHKDQLLVLKRNKEPNKNKYVPVGGKIEAHENPIKCAYRELVEETGIVHQNLFFAGILTETSPVDYNWISYIYTGEIDYIDLPYCDEGELMWIAHDDIYTLDIPTTDIYIYDFIFKKQKFIFDAQYDKDLNLLAMEESISNHKIHGK